MASAFELEPGQTVVSHGIDRDLSVSELSGSYRVATSA